MKKNYLYVLQENMFDCGVAALKTIFLQYGITIKTEDVVRKKINQGTTALELINASKKLGINAKGVKADIENLTKEHLPCIAHIIKEKSYFHYIVILENNSKTKEIVIMNPEFGLEIMSYNDFNELSTGIFIIFDQKERKKVKKKELYNIIKKYIKKNIRIIKTSLFLSLFIIIFSLISNYYLKMVLSFKNNFKYILIITFIFLFVFIFKNIFEYLRNIIIIKLNYNLDREINNDLITHILNLPYRYYSNKTTGELVTIINDVENFKELISKIFIILLIDIILILSLLIFISFYSIYYFLILLVLITILLILAFRYQIIFNLDYGPLKNSKIKYSSSLIESLSAFNTIKNLKLENIIADKNNKKYEENLEKTKKYNLNNSKYTFFNNIISDIFYIVIILISSYVSIYNKQNILNILLFSSMFYLLIGFFNNISESITMYKVYQISVNKIIEVFNENIEKESKEKIGTVEEIKFDKVNFAYNEEDIIKDLSFKIKKKDKVFISGSSGSGKSTIIKLLLKYFEPKKGNIYINNINYNNLESIDIRNKINYVSQEEVLFNDTIYNNLKLINDNEKEIRKAVNTCLIDEFLKKNNINLNYVLEENASNISGGERKKILIARSLLKKSSIVIFDESFNELDLETEKRILSNIKKYYKNLTIVLISHRINNKDLFNKKYIFKNYKLMKEE